MTGIWFEQLEHSLVVPTLLPRQMPRDRIGQVEVTDRYRIGITKSRCGDHRGGPWTDATYSLQASLHL